MAAPKAKASTVTQTTVVANVPITHDDVPYQVGEQFDVLDSELEQLLAVNAVLVVEVPADPAP